MKWILIDTLKMHRMERIWERETCWERTKPYAATPDQNKIYFQLAEREIEQLPAIAQKPEHILQFTFFDDPFRQLENSGIS